ncbi:hypothetical protein H4W26_000460 [Nesterenkonia halotolerans]|uniref:Uncharacterized protein n=1 Tax=Nesterenkonia halotolerans TaxID=225325 RepID=A0ABR9J3X8_9MICC|nr:hypothetical protein [Nesterenkonia halotolerans]
MRFCHARAPIAAIATRTARPLTKACLTTCQSSFTFALATLLLVSA